MPNRLLREGILTSECVNSLSPEAELFYRRLMSVVDDFGRCEARPKDLLLKCYAYRIASTGVTDVERWLAECCQWRADDGQVRANDGKCRQLITVYSVGSKNYLQINNFGQRTRTSKYPPPPSEEGVLRANDGQMPADDGHLSDACASRATTTPSRTTSTTTDFDFGERGAGEGAKNGTNGFHSPPPIVIGNGFLEFRLAAEESGMSGSDVDWDEASTEWKRSRLDFEQQLAAVKGLRDRCGIADDFVLKSLPKNYISRRMWGRRIRAPERKKSKAELLAESCKEFPDAGV